MLSTGVMMKPAKRIPKRCLLFWMTVSLFALSSPVLFAQTSLIDSLEFQLRKEWKPDSLYKLRTQLAEAYLRVNPRKSRSVANKILEMPGIKEYESRLGKTHYIIGSAHFYEGTLDSAQVHVDFSDSYLEQSDQELQKLKNLVLLAAIQRAKGDYEESLKVNLNALEKALALENSYYQGALYNNLGNCYNNLLDRETALKLFL